MTAQQLVFDSTSLPQRLSAVLTSLQGHFDRAVLALANACREGGDLDQQRLDEQQVASYELAFASAELLAARTVLAQLTPTVSEIDRRLAITCAAEAVVGVTERLRGVFVDVDLDSSSLLALAASVEVQALRKAVLSGAALSETGRMLLASQDEVGRVALSVELSIAQEQFRRVAAELVAPLASKIHRHDLIVPEEVLQPLREMGVFGLSIPERLGGSAPDENADARMMVVVTEALSEASLGAAGSLTTRPEILARALLAGGTQAQQTRWLPGIAAGDPLCAIAMTEPDYGSDLANVQLKAARTQGGWLLSGAKTWCTFAGKAGLIMVVARTDPDRSRAHRGLSILLVEKPSCEEREFIYQQPGGGRLIGKAVPTIGYRGMHSFDLVFEDFFVPDANVLGGDEGLGRGFYFAMAGMAGGRMQTAARASGIMRAALLAALRYANDRKSFGAPLGQYALTRAKLARMAARFVGCRQLTYALAPLLGSGREAGEASLAKLYACRCAEWVAREALQIHGGIGYAEESPVSRYFVDARVLSIFEGAEETLALKVIARGLLQRAGQEPPA